jgi:hypothetical protein
MFIVETPSFIRHDHTAGSCIALLHGRNKKGGDWPLQKQAQQRLDETLLRTT